MAYGISRAARGRGAAGSILAAAAVLALAVSGVAGTASAQQAKKTPEKAAPAPKGAAAPAAAAAGAAAPEAQSAWVKLCEKAPIVSHDKDGKEVKDEKNICLTHHERLDGNTGMVLVSAAIRQIEGQDKQALMVMVPLGMMIPPGMRAGIYPKDLWEKLQKNEKVDDSKLKGLALNYTLCHPAGCTAEMEATPDLINDMKAGGGLVVFAVNANGQPIAFPVPLTGFEKALAGPPIDNKKYGEARRALMQQIAQRQQHMIEEYKKQQEAEAKKGGAAAPKGGAAPAAKAPANKK